MAAREDAITRVVTDAKANPKSGEAKALLDVLGPDEIPERAVKGTLAGGNGVRGQEEAVAGALGATWSRGSSSAMHAAAHTNLQLRRV